MNLNDLKPGESATIIKADSERHAIMGLLPGKQIKCIRKGIYEVVCTKYIIKGADIEIQK